MLTFCWDMAVTHALIRRRPRHQQAQMAWIILQRHLAEHWGPEYSVYCSPVIFMVTPCINDIKQVIVQLKHNILIAEQANDTGIYTT